MDLLINHFTELSTEPAVWWWSSVIFNAYLIALLNQIRWIHNILIDASTPSVYYGGR